MALAVTASQSQAMTSKNSMLKQHTLLIDMMIRHYFFNFLFYIGI